MCKCSYLMGNGFFQSCLIPTCVSKHMKNIIFGLAPQQLCLHYMKALKLHSCVPYWFDWIITAEHKKKKYFPSYKKQTNKNEQRKNYYRNQSYKHGGSGEVRFARVLIDALKLSDCQVSSASVFPQPLWSLTINKHPSMKWILAWSVSREMLRELSSRFLPLSPELYI